MATAIAKAKTKEGSGGGRAVLSTGQKVVRGIISGLLILYTCITIFVIGATLMNSFKTKSDLITNFIGIPKSFTLDSYLTILTEDNFMLYFTNSLILTACGTVGCILLSTMVSYGLARYRFKGRGFLSAYFMIGMMVPIQVTIMPVFIILRTMGLLNTLQGLILIYISGISMTSVVFQKFFATIPTALEEAARIDGCHDLRIFFQIILPITKPTIATMALITAIGEWNDFYMPMVLLGNENVKTLTLAVYQYTAQFTRYMCESMAAVVITLIPIIVIYFAFSSQIMEGMTGGAVKG